MWRVLDTGVVEIMVVVAVGQRDSMEVYRTAAKRWLELERWVEQVLRQAI